MYKIALLFLSLLLSGCVSQYNITESELEGYLSDELRFEVKEGNQFIGIELKVNNLDVTLGRKPDTMEVTAESRLKLRNPLMPVNATLNATFEAKPWYDSNSHSVYLRELKLVSIESQPEQLNKALSQLTPQLIDYVSQYLQTKPVYVLDTTQSNEALIAKMAEKIEVVPGKLKVIFKK